MYQINKAIPEAKEHFLKAMRLAKKNNFHAPLLGLSFANFELYQSQLDEFSENERKKAKEYHRLFVEDYAAFLEYSGKNSYYRNITDDEFKFINYILLEVPNKKIAQTEKLSESTINKKLTVIYDKLNVSGRKELYDLVVSVISNKG